MKRYSLLLLFLTVISFCSFSETLKIRIARPVLVYNNQVGDEWKFDVKIEGKSVPIGKLVKIEGQDIIKVVFTAQEVDKVSDFGSASLRIDPAALDANNKEYTDIEVIVSENVGKYKGNTAKWKVRIYYTKIS